MTDRQLREQMDRRSQAVSQASEQMRERKDREMRDNPDYQRRKALGEDGRTREAIDIMAKRIHERDQMGGSHATFDQAKQKAIDIAHNVDRKK